MKHALVYFLFALVQAAGNATLQVQVQDETRAVIEGARVVAKSSDGREREAAPVRPGLYSLSVSPGPYSVRIEARGFGSYEQKAVALTAATVTELNVVLRVRGQDLQVFVTSALPATAVPEFLGGVRVLRGTALDALPNTNDAMMAYLRLLAPRSAGPFGPAILVDGFPAWSLPPKSQIREIRINDNPFSSEYSHVGTSRIEILTKPGTEGWQASVFLNFNDESLNSRNTFSPVRAPFQNRIFGGSFSGPLLRNRMTFRTDVQRAERDDNAIINATIVDPAFTIRPFNHTLIRPVRETNTNGTIGYQITASHTLAATFRFTDQEAANEGVGDFSLQSRAYESRVKTHTLQITETAVLGDGAVNETRFQLSRRRTVQAGNDTVTAIRVPDAFVSGGSDIGRAATNNDSLFLNNHTTWTAGKHTFKGGAELRAVDLFSRSSNNLGGTYTFTGRVAPQLDAGDNPIAGPDGRFVLSPITNIESYRRTLVFKARGMSSSELRSLGGGATFFSMSSGKMEAGARQYEGAAFIKDDWRLFSNLSLDLGVRLETQTNIDRKLDVAPRFAIAWQPIAKTVLRGGSGLFFSRFSEDLSMQARLLNGVIGHQLFTAISEVLDEFPKTLSPGSLASSQVRQSVWRVAADLRAPYNIYSSFSFERVLPLRSTLGLTFSRTKRLHSLRSRNVNAPLPDGLRPLGSGGDVFQFESGGVGSEKQYVVNTTHNLSERVVLWSAYTLTDARSDTDGPFVFPANSHDLRGEYGRAASVARHTAYTGGWLAFFGGIEVTPLIMWRSGLPFNITTGRDSNGDSQFMERPGIATDLKKDSVVQTPFGLLDLLPSPGQPLVAKNSGRGPGFTMVNLRLSKNIHVGRTRLAPDGTRIPSRQQALLSVQVQNLFNKTNLGTPVGNLSSPLFGRSYVAAGDFGFGSNSAGTRRLEFSLNFSF